MLQEKIDSLNYVLPGFEVFVMALLVFVLVFVLIGLYFEFTSRINELEVLIKLQNAAFNNHLRNYHELDVRGGDPIVERD